jgi:hypothetical protein
VDETIRSHLFEIICCPILRPFGLWKHPYG